MRRLTWDMWLAALALGMALAVLARLDGWWLAAAWLAGSIAAGWLALRLTRRPS